MRSQPFRAQIDWVVRDVGALEARLRRLGFDVGARFLSFPSLDVRLTPPDVAGGDRLTGRGPEPGDLLVPVNRAVVRARASAPGPDEQDRRAASPGPDPAIASVHPNGVADCLAIGWATVDGERAAAGAAGSPFSPAEDDGLLGARALVSPGVPATVLLEPATEGRLAATLARHGECAAVLYLTTTPPGLAAAVTSVRAAGGSTTGARLGPFGRSVLLLGGPPWGPHLVVVEQVAPGPADRTRSEGAGLEGSKPEGPETGTIEP